MGLIPADRPLSDEQIVAAWRWAFRLYHCPGTGLGKRLGLAIAEELEAAGVTEAEIERLFPTTTKGQANVDVQHGDGREPTRRAGDGAAEDESGEGAAPA